MPSARAISVSANSCGRDGCDQQAGFGLGRNLSAVVAGANGVPRQSLSEVCHETIAKHAIEDRIGRTRVYDGARSCCVPGVGRCRADAGIGERRARRSEEHTSELQSLMRLSYAAFCLKKKQ